MLLSNSAHAEYMYDWTRNQYVDVQPSDIRINTYDINTGGFRNGRLYQDGTGGYRGQVFDLETGEVQNIRVEPQYNGYDVNIFEF